MAKEGTTQQTIDFGRATQLAALREISPASVAGASTAAQKAVLKAIDDRSGGRPGGCWANGQTLSNDCGLGVRTFRRAVAALIANGLLIVESRGLPGGGKVNSYTLVWSELMVARDRQSAGGGATLAPPVVPPCPPMVPSCPAMVPNWHPKRNQAQRSAPPTSIAEQTGRVDAAAFDAGWLVVLETIVAWGIDPPAASEAIAGAIERGLTDADGAKIAAAWEADEAAGVPALLWRIQNATPARVGEFCRPPNPNRKAEPCPHKRAKRWAREAAHRDRSAAVQRQQQTAQQATEAAYVAQMAPWLRTLDRMPADDVERLAVEVLDDFNRVRWRKNPRDGGVRSLLAAAIRDRQGGFVLIDTEKRKAIL